MSYTCVNHSKPWRIAIQALFPMCFVLFSLLFEVRSRAQVVHEDRSDRQRIEEVQLAVQSFRQRLAFES